MAEKHPATFNATDPNNWITVLTAIIAFITQFGPTLIAIFGQLFSPPTPAAVVPPAGVTAPDVPAEP